GHGAAPGPAPGIGVQHIRTPSLVDRPHIHPQDRRPQRRTGPVGRHQGERGRVTGEPGDSSGRHATLLQRLPGGPTGGGPPVPGVLLGPAGPGVVGGVAARGCSADVAGYVHQRGTAAFGPEVQTEDPWARRVVVEGHRYLPSCSTPRCRAAYGRCRRQPTGTSPSSVTR